VFEQESRELFYEWLAKNSDKRPRAFIEQLLALTAGG
jgi:hypothetical protein